MKKKLKQQVLDFDDCEKVIHPEMVKSHMKDNMRVTVRTNLNGSYNLKCNDGKSIGDYLYFSPEELAIGVAVHVGDGLLTDMVKGDIASIVTDHQLATKMFKATVKKLEYTLSDVRHKRSELTKENLLLKKRLEKYVEKYGDIEL